MEVACVTDINAPINESDITRYVFIIDVGCTDGKLISGKQKSFSRIRSELWVINYVGMPSTAACTSCLISVDLAEFDGTVSTRVRSEINPHVEKCGRD